MLFTDAGRVVEMIVVPAILLVAMIFARRVGLTYGGIGVASTAAWLVLSSIMAVFLILLSHQLMDWTRIHTFFSLFGHLVWLTHLLAAAAILACFMDLHRRTGPQAGKDRS